VDRLCVILKGNFTPTDSLMMRYLMLLNDEAEFRKYAIKQGKSVTVFQKKVEVARPLTEIYKELQAA
jgi:FlaA1/EpsC-like NDP-sugar epimerase